MSIESDPWLGYIWNKEVVYNCKLVRDNELPVRGLLALEWVAWKGDEWPVAECAGLE